MKLFGGARRERYVIEGPGLFRCELRFRDASAVGWGSTCQAAAEDALRCAEVKPHPVPLAETLDRTGGRYAWQNGFTE